MVGTTHRRKTAFARKSTAQIAAITAKIVLARRVALVVGVVDAGEERMRCDLQPVPVEPVAEALHQHGKADQDRQVGLGGRAAASAGPVKRMPPMT